MYTLIQGDLMNIRKYSGLLIPVLAALFFSITGLTGLYRSVDSFFYDIFLHLVPSPEESSNILLIDVDDATIDPNTGISEWPIPREVYGDVLITMKEFEAHSAVFDIEFIGDSLLEFSPSEMEDNVRSPILQELERVQLNVNDYLVENFDLYQNNKITKSELLQALRDVAADNDFLIEEIKTRLSDISINRDYYLGGGAAVLGSSFFASSLRTYDDFKIEQLLVESVDNITFYIDEAPEILSDDVLFLLNQQEVYQLLEAVLPYAMEADESTDWNQLVLNVVKETNVEIDDSLIKLLSSPQVLELFYNIKSQIDSITLQNVVSGEKWVKSYPFMDLATHAVLENCRGIGFANVEVDGDGTRRRMDLLSRTGDFYYPQLGFSAVLEFLGNPDIEVYEDKIVLLDALYPGEEMPQTVSIPLDEEGFMLINWPHKKYLGKRDGNGERLSGMKGEDSFQHLSLLKVFATTNYEQNLYQYLMEISADPDYSWYGDWGEFVSLFPEIQAARRALVSSGYSDEVMDYYRAKKVRLDQLLNGLVHPELVENIKLSIASGEYDDQAIAEMEAMAAQAMEASDNVAEYLSGYIAARDECRRLIPGTLCIVGFTAGSSTDFGVNPFQEQYPNVGSHAATINTILQRDFYDEIPSAYSALLAVLLAFIIYFSLKRISPLAQVATGISAIFLVVILDWVLFISSGSYMPIFAPLMTLTITFVGSTAGRFVSTSREKIFIRKAFSHYLSTDVINEIMKDPDKLKLGGDSRYMTAIFTDVMGFSTISEKLSPVDLVHLLNEYLSDMSDILLDLRGLIDKFEGDAIIAFFGAPHDVPEHAYLSCLAAVRMKRVELKLNKRFLEEEMSPEPLLTRIGINTGEMVVGNMGTATKMNYTMMGSSVNLAARLEGVNKQYGTWILISEETYKEGGDRLFCRKLDRARVVGINKPVRLYEVIEEKSQVSHEIMRGVDFFHKGIENYEARRWTPAIRLFNQALELMPQDPPSKKFIAICEGFLKKAPPLDWDGVNNLKSK